VEGLLGPWQLIERRSADGVCYVAVVVDEEVLGEGLIDGSPYLVGCAAI
jgi:hypothetical protein